jgi:hypothetical protein
VALEAHLFQKVLQLTGNLCGRVSCQRTVNKFGGICIAATVAGERRRAPEKHRPRRLGSQVVEQGVRRLGLQLIRGHNMPDCGLLVAFHPGDYGKVAVFHRLTVDVFDVLHLFSTRATGVPNSTTAT